MKWEILLAYYFKDSPSQVFCRDMTSWRRVQETWSDPINVLPDREVLEGIWVEAKAWWEAKFIPGGFDTGLGFSLPTDADSRAQVAQFIAILAFADGSGRADQLPPQLKVEDSDGGVHTLTLAEARQVAFSYAAALFQDHNSVLDKRAQGRQSVSNR